MPDDGPRGAPHPGRPPEPWPDRPPPDPDDQPTQEWRRPDSWDSAAPQPRYGQPESGHSPYPVPRPGPRHGAAPTGRRGGSSSRTPTLVLVVVLALLVGGGGGTALYLFGSGDEPTAVRSSTKPSAPAPSSARATTATPPASTATPRSSTDARFVKVGQCVRNEGAGVRPRLVITPCRAKTYQVLARFDGATTGENDAKAKCGKVAGYTDWYFFNSELDVLDFVLCLKLR